MCFLFFFLPGDRPPPYLIALPPPPPPPFRTQSKIYGGFVWGSRKGAERRSNMKTPHTPTNWARGGKSCFVNGICIFLACRSSPIMGLSSSDRNWGSNFDLGGRFVTGLNRTKTRFFFLSQGHIAPFYKDFCCPTHTVLIFLSPIFKWRFSPLPLSCFLFLYRHFFLRRKLIYAKIWGEASVGKESIPGVNNLSSHHREGGYKNQGAHTALLSLQNYFAPLLNHYISSCEKAIFKELVDFALDSFPGFSLKKRGQKRTVLFAIRLFFPLSLKGHP